MYFGAIFQIFSDTLAPLWHKQKHALWFNFNRWSVKFYRTNTSILTIQIMFGSVKYKFYEFAVFTLYRERDLSWGNILLKWHDKKKQNKKKQQTKKREILFILFVVHAIDNTVSQTGSKIQKNQVVRLETDSSHKQGWNSALGEIWVNPMRFLCAYVEIGACKTDRI